MFPRASALGERLWSSPSINWKDNFMDVEIRMVTHRQLLVDRGIKADALQPEYCYLSEGSCELHDSEDETTTDTTTTSSLGNNFDIHTSFLGVMTILISFLNAEILNTM